MLSKGGSMKNKYNLGDTVMVTGVTDHRSQYNGKSFVIGGIYLRNGKVAYEAKGNDDDFHSSIGDWVFCEDELVLVREGPAKAVPSSELFNGISEPDDHAAQVAEYALKPLNNNDAKDLIIEDLTDTNRVLLGKLVDTQSDLIDELQWQISPKE
jgi:hypothetical protein